MSQPALYGVVGHPVKHSLSPRIHSFWYDQLELNARYNALDLVEDQAKQDIQALCRAGYSGLNITLPHKMAAFEAATELSEAAKKIGAVNTVIANPKTREWSADNTDWTGFLWSLDRLGKNIPEKAVLIGAGGAARAVAYALNSRGIQLTILNRTVSKAEELAKELSLNVSRVTSLDDLENEANHADLVINTISSGHTGGSLSLPATRSALFIDISYGEAAERTLGPARENGWATEDGLPMLIGQAADAFKLWFNLEPDREAALTAVRNWTGTA